MRKDESCCFMDKIAVLIDFLSKIWYDFVEVSGMNCFFWRGTESSDKMSDRYMYINNFGFYENFGQRNDVSRPVGRSDYQLIAITKGEAYFKVDGKERIIGKNHIILYKPGEEQTYHTNPRTDNFWIHFSGTEIAGIIERFGLCDMVYKIENMAEVKRFFDEMLRCVATEDNTTEDVLCGLLLALLSKIQKQKKNENAGIMQVIHQMKKENFKGLTVKAYAEMAGLSEYHFIRKFKQYTNYTPYQYKAKLLAEKATRFLTENNMKVSDVAELLGFEDSLYFSRFYKKQTGISPVKMQEKR